MRTEQRLTPECNCRYGAPMGRSDQNLNAVDPDKPERFHLARIYLDSGGYDRGGAYWGHGEPLYGYSHPAGTIGYLRATSRENAKEQVREDYPKAKFFN